MLYKDILSLEEGEILEGSQSSFNGASLPVPAQSPLSVLAGFPAHAIRSRPLARFSQTRADLGDVRPSISEFFSIGECAARGLVIDDRGCLHGVSWCVQVTAKVVRVPALEHRCDRTGDVGA